MSKNKFCKKMGLVVALSLLVGLGSVPNVSSAKVSEKDQSFEMLQDWYDDYKVNGNETVAADEEGNQTAKNHAYYYLGRQIFVVTKRTKTNTQVDTVSIGYRAKYKRTNGSYYYGFVTCGHCVRDAYDGNVYASSSNAKNNKNVIGRRYFYAYDGKVDASFVNMNSGHSIDSQTRSNVKISSSIKVVKENEKVSMCGGTSGTVKNKKVLDTFAWRYMYDSNRDTYTYFDGMIETERLGAAGDSGAIVYQTANGTSKIVGIYVGGDDYVGYVIPAQSINKKLGVSAY